MIQDKIRQNTNETVKLFNLFQWKNYKEGEFFEGSKIPISSDWAFNIYDCL